MRRVILIAGILLLAVFSKAQQDNKAKQILDKVSEKNRSFKSISADFDFTMKNTEMAIDEKNEGTIVIKGEKYHLELDAGISVFSDGKTLWTYMKDGNQVTVSDVDDESSELMDPSSLFTIYEKGFKSEFVGEKKAGTKTVYEIDLYPDSDEYDVTKISLLISKSDYMIYSAQLYGTDGNIYGITVKNTETGKNIPDSEFVFDATKYPDVEVIDLR